MKKIFLLLGLLTILTVSCKVQRPISGNASYKSLAKFHKDTLAYLKYNFEANADFYKGKPISVLVNDLEMKIINYLPGFQPTNIRGGKIQDVSLRLGRCAEKAVNINIEMDPPIPVDDIYALSSQISETNPDSIHKCPTVERNFYNQRTVKDIHVYQYNLK